jgi:predicted lipid-binding transport protein (Tim44 family)
MLCPNCGTKTTTEHKFCRNCGMNLEPVSRALAAHLSHDGAQAARAAREAERRSVRRMTRGLMAGIVVVLFGVFLMAAVPGNAFKLLGVLAALLGIIAALAAVFSTLRAAGDAAPAPAPHAPEGVATHPTGRLLHEQTFEPVPGSVTDHTTELLGVEVKERKPRA